MLYIQCISQHILHYHNNSYSCIVDYSLIYHDFHLKIRLRGEITLKERRIYGKSWI